MRRGREEEYFKVTEGKEAFVKCRPAVGRHGLDGGHVTDPDGNESYGSGSCPIFSKILMPPFLSIFSISQKIMVF